MRCDCGHEFEPETKYRHKLIAGDCTDKDVVDRLMDGEKEYNVLTDPPYNIGFEYDSIDDKMDASDYALFCEDWINVVKSANCIIFTPGPNNIRLYSNPMDIGYWLKRNATAGASAFNLRCVEPILIYGNIKQKRTFDYFDYSSGFTKELESARQSAGVENEYAPAKPLRLWEELLNMFDDKPILDVFAGNGTTGIACERLGRQARMIEISPAYCSVILERFEKMDISPELIDEM